MLGWSATLVQAQCDQPFPARLPLRVMLDGPYDATTGLMSDTLRSAGLIPLTEPYSAMGYVFRSGGGGEEIDPVVFNMEGADAIVDWVVVEVRDRNDPGKCMLSRSALIQRDGDIVDLDGYDAVGLCIPEGTYHIAVRHRNHLSIMTGSPVVFYPIQFGQIYADPVDLASPQASTYRDSQSRKRVGEAMVMWSGDVNFDGRVKYTGQDNDRDVVLQNIGGTVPTNVIHDVYALPDVNLDTRVQYTGQDNDRDIILQTVGGTVPTNFREGYLPKDSLTLRPNVHIVDPSEWVLDTALSNMADMSQLVFQVFTDMEGIDTGHVVVGAAQGGFLRKVTAVDSTGGVLSLTTEQGTFYDLFASGTVSLEVPFDFGTASFAGPSEFGTASFSDPSVEVGSSIEFPGGGCVQGGIQNLDITPTGKFVQTGEITSTPLGDMYGWEYRGRLNLKGDLAVSFGVCGALPILEEAELMLTPKIPFEAGIPVVIPPGIPAVIPVAGTFQVVGEMELTCEAGYALNYASKFNMDINGRVGMGLDAALPYPIVAMSAAEPSFEPGPNTVYPSTRTELELYTGIKIVMQLYNVAGPYLSFGSTHSLAMAASTTTDDKDLEYKAGFKLQPGIEADLWKKFDVISAEVESPPIIGYTWPGKLELLSDTVPIGREQQLLEDPVRVRVSPKLEILGFDVPMPPAEGVPVTFNVTSGGGYFLFEGPVLTDVNGEAEAEWNLGNLPDGEQLAQARVRKGDGLDIDGSPLQLRAEIEAFKMELVSGDEQIGSVSTELLNPLVVRIVNQLDEPVEGFPVYFDVVGGTGSLSDDFVATSSEGLASTMFTLGVDAAAQNKVKAFALTLTGDTIEDAPQYFKAYIDPDTMFYAQLSGNFQSGAANTVLPVDLRVQVNSVLGQEPQEDVLVYFQVVSGGGSVSAFGTSTNSEGIASVAWTLGPDLSIRQVVKAWSLDVYGDTLRGGPLEFEACTIICPPTATDIDGNVYPVVKIGCDCWFQENLKTHRFNNGDVIPHYVEFTPVPYVDGQQENVVPWWTQIASSEDVSGQPHDGLIYNHAVIGDGRNLCPTGWRLPSEQAFVRIGQYFGFENSLGSGIWFPVLDGNFRLPSAWPGDATANNITGFSLRPGRHISTWTGTELGYMPNWECWYCSDYLGQGDFNQPHTSIWTKNGDATSNDWTGANSANFLYFSSITAPGGGPYQSLGFGYCRCVMD